MSVTAIRIMHRPRRDRDIVKMVMLAMMRDRPIGRPQPAHDLHSLFEYGLIVLE